ncbi:hypothetical protein GCM10007094_31240 [Pseudovibrio japonicus]|uniref:Uncharacterized protein n=1 Tax=Pseudovibrio japonicus TaxID=366534 RepID=A0ABQ3EHJ3_9HYPH|nr:hypothetical protein GCM10007094_31240 [Pseudovibrio japonicus]
MDHPKMEASKIWSDTIALHHKREDPVKTNQQNNPAHSRFSPLEPVGKLSGATLNHKGSISPAQADLRQTAANNVEKNAGKSNRTANRRSAINKG